MAKTKNDDPRKDAEFKAVVERMLKAPPKPHTPKKAKKAGKKKAPAK
jgi:hypothetical protein